MTAGTRFATHARMCVCSQVLASLDAATLHLIPAFWSLDRATQTSISPSVPDDLLYELVWAACTAGLTSSSTQGRVLSFFRTTGHDLQRQFAFQDAGG